MMEELKYSFSKLAVKTNLGKKRDINEDSVATLRAMRAQNTPDFCQLLAVADGMGGHSKGEIASSMAINNLFSEIVKGWQSSHNSFDSDSAIELVESAYRTVNDLIYSMSQTEQYKGMGTTLVAFVNLLNITSSYHIVSNVGDSRCYIMDDEKITQLTRDDSEVQDMIDRKEISLLQARTHPHKNRITNAVGVYSKENFKPTVQLIDLAKHVDLKSKKIYVVLCSDGLHSVVFDREIFNEVIKNKSVSEAANRLIEMANERGGPDNISVIIGRIMPGRLS